MGGSGAQRRQAESQAAAQAANARAQEVSQAQQLQAGGQQAASTDLALGRAKRASRGRKLLIGDSGEGGVTKGTLG